MSVYVEFQKEVDFEGLEEAMRRAADDLGYEFDCRDQHLQDLPAHTDTPHRCYRVTLAGVKTPWGTIRALLYRKAKESGLRLYECADVGVSQQDEREKAAITDAHALRAYVEAERAERPYRFWKFHTTF